MNITIIGTGYVGLVTGTCFADKGNKVMCMDIDEQKIKKLREGIIPIYEPGLELLLKKNIEKNNLCFTLSIDEALCHSDIIFLALPTPPNEDGSADLSHVLKVAHLIGEKIDRYKLIVNKSTVPVGTADKVKSFIASHTTIHFDVISNPEFLREGMAVEEFMHPDRVIIGTDSEVAQDIMKELYAPFILHNAQLVYMDIRSAEMSKYAANAFLATRLSFINEIANLCERTGANIDEVKNGIGYDKRIGHHFLNAGAGYGGSCFPKDVKALINTANDHNYDFQILKTVDKVNKNQRLILFDKINDFYKGQLKNKVFAVWGLAFKPKTDDVREASAKYVIKKLVQNGAKVQAYDPKAMNNFMLYGIEHVIYKTSAINCLLNADALIIMTEWDEFKNFDLKKLYNKLPSHIVFDGRNIYDINAMQSLGFHYESIGRKKINNE